MPYQHQSDSAQNIVRVSGCKEEEIKSGRPANPTHPKSQAFVHTSLAGRPCHKEVMLHGFTMPAHKHTVDCRQTHPADGEFFTWPND
jgi:hypothetical protein